MSGGEQQLAEKDKQQDKQLAESQDKESKESQDKVLGSKRNTDIASTVD